MKVIGKCKICLRRLTEATAYIDNGALLCKEHAEKVMDERYGANHKLIPTVKAITMKNRRNAA